MMTRRVFSAAIAFLLVLFLMPVTPPFAFGDESAVDGGEINDLLQSSIGFAGEEMDLDSNPAVNEASSSSPDASQSTDVSSEGDVAEIEYLLIERSEVPVGEEQNIVVSFKDNSVEFDSAALVVTNLSGSKNFFLMSPPVFLAHCCSRWRGEPSMRASIS